VRVIISFLGVGVIALGEGKGLRIEPGALIILISAVSASIYLVLQKHYLETYSALELTTYTIWAGTLFLLVFARGFLPEIRHSSLGATMAVVYLGVFPAALAYITWAYVLKRLTASRTASFVYLMPPLTLVIAWLWLGEKPTGYSFAGGLLALAGVVLVNMRPRPGAEPVLAQAG